MEALIECIHSQEYSTLYELFSIHVACGTRYMLEELPSRQTVVSAVVRTKACEVLRLSSANEMKSLKITSDQSYQSEAVAQVF